MLAAVTRTAPQAHPLTEDEMYDAFVRRDRSYRDRVLMGVLTTGVYCRPGCAARTPLRKNVRFFDTAEQARAAGLRACKRCKPDDPAQIHSKLVERACRTLETAEFGVSLDALAREAGLSPFHFHRVFKAETGVTPGQYAAAVKDRRAKAALQEGASVTAAVYDAGYGSASRFYEGVKNRFGMTPKAWRGGGIDSEIRVAIAPCSLGWVLVGATDKGLCTIEIGADPAEMQADFATRFAKARTVQDDAGLATLVRQVVELIEAPGAASADLPLDVRGTAFQQRVWDALRRIPPGEVWTYGQLAEAIGAPKAVRAVGAACGANPVAVVVPCHRVVGANRSLTGYRWGVERKRELLKREGQG